MKKNIKIKGMNIADNILKRIFFDENRHWENFKKIRAVQHVYQIMEYLT